MKAFITGSRAYGDPDEDSDVDLVIRCSEETANIIRKLKSSKYEVELAEDRYGDETTHVNIGGIDLILCTTDLQYVQWAEGTEKLIEIAPVTREEAVAVFAEIRKREMDLHS